MDRRDFLSTLSLAAIGTNMQLQQFHQFASELPGSDKMPALFVGHGSPMNALEKNEFSNKWFEVGKKLPIPKAILVVSAHWQTRGTKVPAGPASRSPRRGGRKGRCRYAIAGRRRCSIPRRRGGPAALCRILK